MQYLNTIKSKETEKPIESEKKPRSAKIRSSNQRPATSFEVKCREVDPSVSRTKSKLRDAISMANLFESFEISNTESATAFHFHKMTVDEREIKRDILEPMDVRMDSAPKHNMNRPRTHNPTQIKRSSNSTSSGTTSTRSLSYERY